MINIYTDDFLLTLNIKTIIKIFKKKSSKKYNIKNLTKVKTIIK